MYFVILNRVKWMICVYVICISSTWLEGECAVVTTGGRRRAGTLRDAEQVPVVHRQRKVAMHWRSIGSSGVQCILCPRQCRLSPGQRGFCGVRENRNGELISLVHSLPCALHIDPVEKKPLYNFLPGIGTLSIATAGCNLRCKFCQNHNISQRLPEEVTSFVLSPEEVVHFAVAQKVSAIAYTYSEPTVFYEYMLETAKLARKAGLKNIIISNGYINPVPLRELAKELDGANIDLKGFTNSFYQELCNGTLEPVLESLKILRQEGVWLEITNLIIPTRNDNFADIKRMCEWIRDSLGVDVPLHFSRFLPSYKLKNLPPTPEQTLEKARDIAIKAGLKYVYIGNVRSGHPAQNTYCDKCGKVIIKRQGYQVLENSIVNNKCSFCNNKVSGLWSSY